MSISQIFTRVERALDIKKALEKAIKSLNTSLADTPGHITEMKCNIKAGMAGAKVRVSVGVDEGSIAIKKLLWANESGSDEVEALQKAEHKINNELDGVDGEIADFYQEFISPPVPRRTYATIIVAVNEAILISEDTGELSAKERRERLAGLLRLLGNDSRAVNISRLAKVFRVSRNTIYEDLRKIGADR